VGEHRLVDIVGQPIEVMAYIGRGISESGPVFNSFVQIHGTDIEAQLAAKLGTPTEREVIPPDIAIWHDVLITQIRSRKPEVRSIRRSGHRERVVERRSRAKEVADIV